MCCETILACPIIYKKIKELNENITKERIYALYNQVSKGIEKSQKY